MAAWVQKGEEQTREFLSKTLRYYLFIAIPGTFGFIAISENVVVLMASEKYREAAEVIPYIVAGGMTFAGCLVFRTTLLIKQKTGLLACLMVFACILNIVTNVLLIPRCGLVGAALSTLLSYVSLVSLIVLFSFRYLPIRIETVPILRYVLFGSIMFLIIREIELGGTVGSLGGKVVCGIAIYGALTSIFDPEIRGRARSVVIARLRK
jgi:O-antigen/teichoic acid export membrane protein